MPSKACAFDFADRFQAGKPDAGVSPQDCVNCVNLT